MKTRYLASVAVIAGALLLSGCANNAATPTTSAGASTAATVTTDAASVALLPASTKSAGKLVFGTDAAYPPNEFKDENGNPVGWDIELSNAIAAKLGLKAEYQLASFDNLIPSIVGGKIDVGVSSFTDNAKRQEQVDFVDYFSAGVLWAAPAGKTVDPNNACGLKVGVQTATYEETEEVPAKSKACTDAGKPAIEIQKFDAQDAVASAVALGKVDAMSADSPVTLYAIEKSAGKLIAAGSTFEPAPYGFPLQKNSPLIPAFKSALESLIADGTYKAILAKWGVEAGGVSSVTVNAGS